jgi:predicted enzyme related to lactoylglutathione lyase
MSMHVEIPCAHAGSKIKFFESDLTIEEATLHIEQAGGKMIISKIAVPCWGWMAFFTDTEGNCHGILQKDAMAPAEIIR